MTEQERAPALADEIEAFSIRHNRDGRTWPDDYLLSEKVDVRSMMRLALEAELKKGQTK